MEDRWSRLSALVAFVVALLAAATFAACGDDDDDGGNGKGGGGGEGRLKIALLLPETKTTRYEKQDRPNFERRVKELCPDCEVIYSNADQDPAKQQQQAEAAITQGAKVIVISAVDVESAGAIVQSAKQSDVKVIAYGRLIQDADIDYYVSIDPFKVGQQQAEVQIDALDEGRREEPADRDDQRRADGHATRSRTRTVRREVLERARAKIVKEYDTPDWSPDKAQQRDGAVDHRARQGRLRRASTSANDGMAGGAIAASRARTSTRRDAT